MGRSSPEMRGYDIRLFSGLLCLLLLLGAALSPGAAAPDPAPAGASPALQGNRAPIAIVFAAEGRTAFVSEQAEDSIAVIDAESGRVTGRIPSGGSRPAGLAVLPGDRLLVCNSYGPGLALLDTKTHRVLKQIDLPGMPQAVVVHPSRPLAYVSVSQLDQIAVIDLERFHVSARIAVGDRPGSLAVLRSGAALIAANFSGGSLSIIDTARQVETARVPLKGRNVRGLAIPEDELEVFTNVMPAFNNKPTNEARQVWHNFVQSVKLTDGEPAVSEEQWMDFARLPGSGDVIGSPDGQDIAVDAAGSYAWISVGGRDVVSRITVRDRRRAVIWPSSQIEVKVGANPRGLAMRPGGAEIWVANHLGNSISVIDTGSLRAERTIDLGRASRVDPAIAGLYLFNSAGLTRSSRFTCNSCHPDGGSDGLTWNFVHVPDGFKLRNTRDLRSGVLNSAPFRWSGFDATLPEFVRSEVTGLLFGPEPGELRTRQLAAALGSFRLPPNPYRQAGQQLTPAAQRGSEIFEGKARCSGCHSGALRGGGGIRAEIGTTPEGLRLDVPQLLGVHDTAPYLHDGSAPTLESIFTARNREGRHGNYQDLTPDEKMALLDYLRQL